MTTEPVRLSRRVVEVVGCSRAEADRYIENGWVRVDGVVVEEPQHKVAGGVVTLDDGAEASPVEPATILLHKGPGVVASARGADGVYWAEPLVVDARAETDRTGIRSLRRHQVRLVEAMPLPASASGLVVVSQDKRVLDHLHERGSRLEQEWLVEVRGGQGNEVLRKLSFGGRYEGRVVGACKVSWQSEDKLRFALPDVRPGQLEAQCGAVGLEVLALKRLRIGRIGLAKMPAGAWRYLPSNERF
jgi:23S rRNA pseudouridine2604 synthase